LSYWECRCDGQCVTAQGVTFERSSRHCRYSMQRRPLSLEGRIYKTAKSPGDAHYMSAAAVGSQEKVLDAKSEAILLPGFP
jgi:hypothetical protein